MAGTHRVPTTVALIVCLLGGPGGGTLFAAGEEPASSDALSARTWFAGPPPAPERSLFTFTDQSLVLDPPAGAARAQAWQGTFNVIPAESTLLAQRGGFRGRGRRGNSGSAAAIVLGAAATIAGAAVLVYANRPECSRNQGAEGCGYGTKVVGGAVLSAGVVGIFVGALTWR
jgi:hypothetical protein